MVIGVALIGLSLAMCLVFVAIVAKDWNAPRLSATEELIASICATGFLPVGLVGVVLVTVGLVRRRRRAREVARMRWQRAQEAVR